MPYVPLCQQSPPVADNSMLRWRGGLRLSDASPLGQVFGHKPFPVRYSVNKGHAKTAAWLAGASETTIMRQTSHTNEQRLRKYIETAELFTRNSALALGL